MSVNNAQNIRLIRKVAKLTQPEFAEKLGVSVDQIKNFEQGRSKPDIFIKKRLVEFAGIDLGKLDYTDLTENDIIIEGDDQQPPVVNEDTVEYQKISNLTHTSILKLANANEILAQSNRTLADNNQRLITLVETTVNGGKQIPSTFDSKFADLLAAIAEVASGEKKYKSSEEAYASLSRRFFDTLPKNEAVGTHLHSGS